MSLSILLVDDSEVNLKVASFMIKKLGHQVNIARNGAEAVQALDYHNYDIVLMDIEMPVMDGIEATKVIRQRHHHIPKIIAVTALTNSREVCLDAGADDFLAKPLRIENLRDSIEYNISIQSFHELVPCELERVSTASNL